MDPSDLSRLADELEAEYGPSPYQRDNLEVWLLVTLCLISSAGVTEPATLRARLHERYLRWLHELEQELWLNLSDVGLEIIDEADNRAPHESQVEPHADVWTNGSIHHRQLATLGETLENAYGAFPSGETTLLSWIADSLASLRTTDLDPGQIWARLALDYMILVERDQPADQARESLDPTT